jgi:hypothetical protein
MKVDTPRCWQSPAPTRAKMQSRTAMRASEHGTNAPTCAISTTAPTCARGGVRGVEGFRVGGGRRRGLLLWGGREVPWHAQGRERRVGQARQRPARPASTLHASRPIPILPPAPTLPAAPALPAPRHPPTWRMKVDLPPMLGPVTIWNQLLPRTISQSLEMNSTPSCASTHGCLRRGAAERGGAVQREGEGRQLVAAQAGPCRRGSPRQPASSRGAPRTRSNPPPASAQPPACPPASPRPPAPPPASPRPPARPPASQPAAPASQPASPPPARAPAAAQHQLALLGAQHGGAHVAGGRARRQVSKARQHVQLGQQRGHGLPHLGERARDVHHLHGRQAWEWCGGRGAGWAAGQWGAASGWAGAGAGQQRRRLAAPCAQPCTQPARSPPPPPRRPPAAPARAAARRSCRSGPAASPPPP